MNSYGGAFIYSNLPQALKDAGIIQTNLYSLYMDSNASTGRILFGGIDHAKYSGDLATLPLVNIHESNGHDKPITLDVDLEGMTISDSQDEYDILTTSMNNLLDSGTTLNYLPSSSVSAISKALGATYSSRTGYYVVSCPSSITGATINYKFDGKTIKVPIEDMLTPLDSTYRQCA
jgi:yapsin 1